MTRIEHLSNEVLYEIFDYLDGCEIYHSLFNLNSRFQRLITCSTLSLKINFRPITHSELIQLGESIIFPNKHRLLSLSFEKTKFINDFFAYYILDSSFIRLHSIVFKDVEGHNFLFIVSCLKPLLHLVSLTMSMTTSWIYNLNHIYRTILSFPSLKYNKLSLPPIAQCDNPNIFLPVAINEQFTTIEYLVLDHHCAFFEIYSLLCHTPRLRHLICSQIVKESNELIFQKSITLSDLTYISMDICVRSLDHFELFMTKLFAPVQGLRIRYHDSTDHLDDNGWERLIKNNLPYLSRFHYENHQSFTCHDQNDFDFTKINQFTSPFWVKRQWFGELILNMETECANCLYYPHNNAWFVICKRQEIASYNSKSIIPIVFRSNDNSTNAQSQLFLDKFKSAFIAIHFTHLNINCENISVNLLLKIIRLLPYLCVLKVSSLPIIQSDWFFDNHAKIHSSTLIDNKITEVSLEKINAVEQIYFILYLCHRMQHLQLDVPQSMDLHKLVRFILQKPVIHARFLNSLCLSTSNANEAMTDQLQEMIQSEKLLFCFNIQCICHSILLKWNQVLQ